MDRPVLHVAASPCCCSASGLALPGLACVHAWLARFFLCTRGLLPAFTCPAALTLLPYPAASCAPACAVCSDALMAGVRLHRIGDYQLAWVEGAVGPPADGSEVRGGGKERYPVLR